MKSAASGSNSVEIGKHNRHLVLDVIRTHEPVSRPEIARLTGLTTATVTNIVGKLQKDRLVEEVGLGQSTGGRKPGLLQLARNSRLAIAVDLAATELMVALTNVKGEILRRSKREIAMDIAVTVPRMVDAIKEVMTCPEVGGATIVGIGVTTPGLIDQATGTIIKSVRLDWYHVPLKSILQRHFEVPVFVGKDTATAILGEQWYGAARHADNLIYVWVGTGIAVGFLFDGRVYAGATGMAGEFGHTSIEWNGARCKCGNEGCLEGLASLGAIASKASCRALSEENAVTREHPVREARARVDPFAVLDAACIGDLRAREIVREAGRYLGVGIANLINLFNPERIVIGGQIRPKDKEFIDTAIEVAKSRVLPEPGSSVTITVSDFGPDAGLIGAAALVWREILASS
ncbi:MAG: ROK family transcriptional regulator [Firmicutes bacterium]|nr:ROK family transcriptional regulator [Bacillota bacterium]